MLTFILLLLPSGIKITSVQPIAKSVDTLVTTVSDCNEMSMDIVEK